MFNFNGKQGSYPKFKTPIGALSKSAGFTKTDGVTVDTSSKEFIRKQNEGIKRLQQQIKGHR